MPTSVEKRDKGADTDASWEEELRRRVDAVRAGTAKTVSAEDVHAQARNLYYAKH